MAKKFSPSGKPKTSDVHEQGYMDHGRTRKEAENFVNSLILPPLYDNRTKPSKEGDKAD